MNRSACAVDVLRDACENHGVPNENIRLECNGQNKMLVRMGRIIIMQEPIEIFGDPPKIADYKAKLASTSIAVAQLELDLQDGWYHGHRVVGLHPRGSSAQSSWPQLYGSAQKPGGVTLAVPDAAYSHWTRRFDLYEIAMFGRKGGGWLEADSGEKATSKQYDEVFVDFKKKTKIEIQNDERRHTGFSRDDIDGGSLCT